MNFLVLPWKNWCFTLLPCSQTAIPKKKKKSFQPLGTCALDDQRNFLRHFQVKQLWTHMKDIIRGHLTNHPRWNTGTGEHFGLWNPAQTNSRNNRIWMMVISPDAWRVPKVKGNFFPNHNCSDNAGLSRGMKGAGMKRRSWVAKRENPPHYRRWENWVVTMNKSPSNTWWCHREKQARGYCRLRSIEIPELELAWLWKCVSYSTPQLPLQTAQSTVCTHNNSPAAWAVWAWLKSHLHV